LKGKVLNERVRVRSVAGVEIKISISESRVIVTLQLQTAAKVDERSRMFSFAKMMMSARRRLWK
jgi:hypothetical protein